MHLVSKPKVLMLILGFVLATIAFETRTHAENDPAFTRITTDQAPRTKDEQLIIDAYRKTNKAVVNISAVSASLDIFGPVYQQGTGSGVIIDAEKGLIVTNFHVINNAKQVAVTTASGHSYQARLVGEDADNEIALLEITAPAGELVHAELGDSASLEVGQRVIAIGNPFGLTRTLTTGIVSSLGRSIRSQSGRVIEDVIQTDAAINPGNSGGPLMDTAGRIVGLNTAIVSSSGSSAGIGFAIPVNQVKKTVLQLIKYGKVLRPYIGIYTVDTDEGPAIVHVEPGSPAAKARLQGARREARRGRFSGYTIDFSHADIIVAVNGTPVRDRGEMLTALAKTDSDNDAILIVKQLADGQRREVRVKPELR